MSKEQENQPSQSAVFAASEPFGSQPSFQDGRGPFIGVDAFAPDGPVPMFGAARAPGEVKAECLDIHRSLGVFLDGALTPAQDHAVRSHLASCPPCAGAQAFHMQLRATVAAKSSEVAPDSLRSRISAALELSAESGYDLDE